MLTHPGGMNTPEEGGDGVAGGCLLEGSPAELLATTEAPCCCCCSNCSGCCCCFWRVRVCVRITAAACSLVSPPPPGRPVRMWFCAASQASRQIPGPRSLRDRPAPLRLSLAPTPRPRVTPGPRPRPGTSRGLQAGTAPPTSAPGVSRQPEGRGEAWSGQEEHRGDSPDLGCPDTRLTH